MKKKLLDSSRALELKYIIHIIWIVFRPCVDFTIFKSLIQALNLSMNKGYKELSIAIFKSNFQPPELVDSTQTLLRAFLSSSEL